MTKDVPENAIVAGNPAKSSLVGSKTVVKVRVFSSVGEPGAPAFWTSWIAEMEKAGLDVKEVSAVSYQQYRAARGLPSRFVLRFKMYVGMLFHLVQFGVLSPEGSILVVTTNPFYAPPLLAVLAWRCKVINLVYDLYPEVFVAAGKIRSGGVLEACLEKLNRTAVRESDATVYLGSRIRQHMTQRYGAASKGKVIPVGTDCARFPKAPTLALDSPIEILYCGNLGTLHDTDALLQGFRSLDIARRDKYHFRFHASGARLDHLIKSVRECGLSDWFTFGGALDNQAWQNQMTQAPIGLVLLAGSARLSAVPSKVYSAMAAGQAILALCPRNSDLADIVLENNCGWVVDPGDPSALKETLERIAQDTESIHINRCNAYRAANANYGMPIVAGMWAQLIKSLSRDATGLIRRQ